MDESTVKQPIQANNKKAGVSSSLRVKARFDPNLRHTNGVMNPLEAAYADEVLEPLRKAGEILEWWFESWKWRLKAKGTWFTPDFVVMRGDGTLEVHETKGFMREDAWLKLKLFEALFPVAVYVIQRRRKSEPFEIKPVGDSPDCPFQPAPPKRRRQPKAGRAEPVPVSPEDAGPAWPR